jgi:hypothetical protein
MSCAHNRSFSAFPRDHHLYNLALCGSLVRVHRLRVNVERYSAVRVPQEFLNRLDIFSIRLKQSAEGVTESMPADLLVNAICLRNWPDMTLHEIVGPIGLPSPHRLAGEDVIVIR